MNESEGFDQCRLSPTKKQRFSDETSQVSNVSEIHSSHDSNENEEVRDKQLNIRKMKIISKSDSRNKNSTIPQKGHFSSIDKTKRAPLYDIVSVDQLMSKDPPYRKTVIYLILLRIVSSSTTNYESRPYSIKNLRKKNSSQGTSSYSRIFLCMDPNSLHGQTVYLVQGRGIGEHLWSKNTNLRDDGVLSIGTTLALYNPKAITKLLANEIPIIETNSSLLMMERKALVNVAIDNSVPEHNTRGFIMNHCSIQIKSIEVFETNCIGHFCDKQRCEELARSDKPCGCYQMRGTGSNLAIVHSLKVKFPVFDEVLGIENFSSMKFSYLYLNEYFPQSTKRISFDGTENLDDLYDCIDNVMDFYNNQGGFTVIGWYKRGEINDTSKSEDNVEKVSSSILGHHIVSVYPTNYLHSHAEESTDLKFDVMNLSI